MLDIKVTVRRAPFMEGTRRIPYKEIADKILGSRYELSLVICADELARRMYKEHRLPSLKLPPPHKATDGHSRQASNKTYAPNVLSFPLDRAEGEIFLNVRKAQREARLYGISVRTRLGYLYIHACFHLKGLNHGAKMESAEARIMKSFNL